LRNRVFCFSINSCHHNFSNWIIRNMRINFSISLCRMLAHQIISVWKIITFSRCELAWTFWDIAMENS
jgi:hypothetical protein